MKLRCLTPCCFVILSLAPLVGAQQAASSFAPVPRLVNVSGKATDGQGKPVSGVAGITFAIYADQDGGAPLWLETKNVQADVRGNYTASLGAASAAGLPLELFSSGDARWLGVRVNGGREQPRVMLLSVPYALKAGDAATVGGLPPSAFVLAAPATSQNVESNGSVSVSASVVPPASSDVTTTGGTVNSLPLFTSATNVQSSAIAQTGSGATAKIGIGTTAPAATLDIHGAAAVRGTLMIPATGAATAAGGKPSEPINITASSFNSGTAAAVGQTFQLKAEQANNNTATPGATLNLLYGSGSATPAETGL